MRIHYVITRGVVGGAQAHVLALLEGMRADVSAELIVGEEGFLADRVRDLDVPVHVVPELTPRIAPRRDLTALRRIRAILADSRPDLVHAHSSKAGVLGRLAAHRLGIPAVFTAHGWAFDDDIGNPGRSIALLTERRAARWSSRIITVSDADRRLALDRHVGRPDQIVTITNGVADAAPSAGTERSATPVVVMIGRFEEQKDQKLLVQAAGRTSTPVELWLVGDGPTLAAITEEIDRLGLRDRVRLLGARTDVAELLAGADVLALASNREGMPLTILEGMRAGLPVVASDVGGVREEVDDEVTGYLVAKGDVDGFAARLDMLCADPDLRARLGAAGRRVYEQHFTVEAMLRETRAVYDVAGGSGYGSER